MEKKNNKKLFAIIGGSVLAFILTIALSVSITLAYFGDVTQDDETIKMGVALEFDQTATKVEVSGMTAGGALPGDTIAVSITAKIKQTSTNGYIRMQLTPEVVDATGSDITVDDFEMGAITVTGVTGAQFVKHSTDGYYYLTSDSNGDNSTMFPVNAKDAAVTLTITFNYTVSPELTNDVAEEEIKLTADFGTVQSANIGTTLGDVADVFDDATID